VPVSPISPTAAAWPQSRLGRALVAGAAAVELVAVDLLIRLLPFARIADRIEGELRWRAPESEAEQAARRVAWAIAAAKRRIPWTIRCLALAVTANRMLARRGVPSRLWLGVKPASVSIDAHAWLVAEGRVVTGAASQAQYTPLHSLVTAPPRA
jgi:hypothetical protein